MSVVAALTEELRRLPERLVGAYGVARRRERCEEERREEAVRPGHRRDEPVRLFAAPADGNELEEKAIRLGVGKRDEDGGFWLVAKCRGGCDREWWLPCPNGLTVVLTTVARCMRCEECGG